MLKFRTLLFTGLAGAAMLTASAAKADTITLTLTNAYQSATGGTTLTYDATLAITGTVGDTYYLGGDSYGTSDQTNVALDDSDYLYNWPLELTIGSGGTVTYTGALFAVDIATGTTSGLYTGYFVIQGNTDGGDDTETLASADFNVNVTPEPSQLVLLLTGMLVLGWLMRKRLVY